jgi:hypothetical protein
MSRPTQADRLLAFFKERQGRWVQLSSIMNLYMACHTRRIHELRKRGFIIEMRDHYIEGQRLVEYRFMGKAPENNP